MKIKILRGTVVSGKAVKTGDVIDCPEADALMLIVLNKAEVAKELPVEKAPSKLTKKGKK